MSAGGQALRYCLAIGIPFLATLGLTPIAGRLAHRLGILDQPQGHKVHLHPTPYLGGLAVAGGLILVGAIAGGVSGQLLTILLCGLAIGAMGLVDDWRTVRPEVKLLVEVGAGLALWLVGVRAAVFDIYGLDVAATVLWVVTVTNALNLIDNMDGLSAGLAGIAALIFFAVAASRGDYLVGSFALAVAGSSLGFLRHNFPPARIFLGDAGSLLVGFLLAALALKLDLVGERGAIRAAVPVLILAVPLFDLVLVIASRLRRKRRIYIGGTDHSSHRLVLVGLSPRSVALTLYLAQLASGALALWLLVLSAGMTIFLVSDAAVVAGVGLVLFLRLDPRVDRAPALRDGREEEEPERARANAPLAAEQ